MFAVLNLVIIYQYLLLVQSQSLVTADYGSVFLELTNF